MAAEGGVVTEALNIVLIHDLMRDVIGNVVPIGEKADPEHQHDQLNELAVTRFRKLFREQYEPESVILNKVYLRMSEGDETLFSLTILCAAEQTARGSTEKDADARHRLLENRITVKPKSEGDGKKAPKAETVSQEQANIFCDKNYSDVITDLADMIQQCKPANGNEEQWVNNLLHELDENGWISGKAADKIVRHFRNPDVRKKWCERLHITDGVKTSIVREAKHQGRGFGRGLQLLSAVMRGETDQPLPESSKGSIREGANSLRGIFRIIGR